MKNNLGTADRVIRIVIAAIIIILYATCVICNSIWGIILLVIGGIFLVTGIIGFCPLYHLLKISTNKKTKEPEQK
jgi:hypothetical protein